jgi:hypothetical protein
LGTACSIADDGTNSRDDADGIGLALHEDDIGSALEGFNDAVVGIQTKPEASRLKWCCG